MSDYSISLKCCRSPQPICSTSAPEDALAIVTPAAVCWRRSRCLDVSELTSSSEKFKKLTTGIATWIRETIHLHDGHRPHGIVYPSKWGSTLTNYAMWLRRTDDQTGPDDLAPIETTTIGLHTKPFVDTAKLRGMKTF